jgi:putative flippase GtrA
MSPIFRQLGWFVAVGCAAAATHWLAAVACIALLAVRPFLANFIGWAVAVVVSFLGHYFLTFRHQEKTLLPAIGRFLVISASGFAINELAFVSLLQLTSVPYYWLLAMILVAIAFLTFIFSRYWAFLHTG